MSRRHTDESLLAAAREVVAEVGIGRTTVADVARRAGASRMTIYRAFPDGATLWSTLLTSEFADIIRGAEEEAASLPTARLRLVEATILTVRRLIANDLVRRIIESDPERLLPYVVERLGHSQKAVLAIFHKYLEDGRQDGSIRELDLDTASYCLATLVRSFILGARITEEEADPEAVYAELRFMIDTYLRPGYVA